MIETGQCRTAKSSVEVDDGLVADEPEVEDDAVFHPDRKSTGVSIDYDNDSTIDRRHEEEEEEEEELDNPFQVAAQIVKGPVSVSTLVGSTVVLEALIIGRPEPTVRWLKGVMRNSIPFYIRFFIFF